MGVLYNNNKLTNAFVFELILNTEVGNKETTTDFIKLITDATDEFNNISGNEGYNLKFMLDPSNGFPDFKLQYSLEDTGIAKLVDFMDDIKSIMEVASEAKYNPFVKTGVYSQKQITTKMNTPEMNIKFRAYHSKTQPKAFVDNGISTYDMVLPYLISATSPLTESIYDTLGKNLNGFLDNLVTLKNNLTSKNASSLWSSLQKVGNLIQLVGTDPDANTKHDLIVQGVQGTTELSDLLNKIQNMFTSAIGHVCFNIKMGISLYNRVYESEKVMWGIYNFSYTPSMQFFLDKDGKPKPYYIDFEIGLKAIQVPDFYRLFAEEPITTSNKNT